MSFLALLLAQPSMRQEARSIAVSAPAQAADTTVSLPEILASNLPDGDTLIGIRPLEADTTRVVSEPLGDGFAIPDSLRVEDADSMAGDRTAMTRINREKADLENSVAFSAKDSVVLVGNKLAYFFGEGEVEYGSFKLNAEEIKMVMDSTTVYANGRVDSVGELQGKPVFQDGGDSYESKTMSYNFKNQRGFITDIVTEQGEGYLTGGRAKKMADGSFFAEEALDELATSIRELGVVQPLTLRLSDDGDYQIIAGERRWRAAKMAGLTTVPAYVRTVSDSEMTEMALIENIQREDLNAIEVALGFKKLIDSYHLTQERLSERLGKKRATIANHLRLLRLPAEIQLGLRDRKLDMGHARAILSIEDPKMQIKVYQRILKEGLSVRAVEEIGRKIAEESEMPNQAAKPAVNPYKDLAGDLSKYFSTPVKISKNASGRGTISISFENDDQLAQLVKSFEQLSK